MMKFPTEWKIKNVPFMFQTTNQMVVPPVLFVGYGKIQSN